MHPKPAQAYTSAQLARSAFPRGHLVTYQGTPVTIGTLLGEGLST